MINLIKNSFLVSMLSLSLLSASAQSNTDMRNIPIPPSPITEMSYSSDKTYFSLWAPTAEEVVLTIYPTGEGGAPDNKANLDRTSSGKWSIIISGDLEGKFYTFKVKVNGKWLDETPGIFAKAVGVNGQRAAIIDMEKTNPYGWEKDQRPYLNDYSDIILYEMHHRDFSVDNQSGIKNKGKFIALTEEGTHNEDGLSTGIDHLKQLGVTHVHILPSYDFGSIDEKHPEYAYNWGYDPVNYNVPEGSYSTDPFNPITRIREFKQMVMAMHKAGICVVLDVVYNHVFDAASSPFGRTVPDYFFRHNADGTLANGSGCGNETASEMPMMRKYMVESILYWLKEYHIDGFRFDLMGIHDIETMNAIRDAVNAIDPSIFIYGEGWAASAPTFPDKQLSMKAHTKELPGIAAFGDEMRDGLRGGWTDDKEGAFLIGKVGYEESVKFGIVGAIQHPQIDYSKINYSQAPWAEEPTQMISYVSCHDDMCLADRIKTTLAYKQSKEKAEKVSDKERIRLHKLAETAVLTSQGIPFIWCGDEIVRDKKGVHNSYNSPDSINAIPWKQKTKYKEVFDYISHLINIRKHHKAFHMGSAELVSNGLEFLPTSKNVIAYRLNGVAVGDNWKSIIVVLNSNKTTAKVSVPRGDYVVICNNGIINEEGISNFTGSMISVPAQSALIMHE